MVLDPVHVEGIARHARRIGEAVDEREQQQVVDLVWQEFLDPLHDEDGTRVIAPLDEQALRKVDIEAAALQEPLYATSHGLDSGTINPTSFKNGLVLDVAQAAMAADPSTLDLHRQRTLITTVHSDGEHVINESTEKLDGGRVESRLLHAPSVPRLEESVVHELSMYLAESDHARSHFDAVEDILVLDGPIYPKRMLNWPRVSDLQTRIYDDTPQNVLRNYLRLVEMAVDQEIPLIGFVKNPAARTLTRTLKARDSTPEPPWGDDTAFFIRLLEQVDYKETVDADGDPQIVRNRQTDVLTYTNWFFSRGSPDGDLAAPGDAFGIDRELSPESYQVTFFMLYDPRDDLLYRVEAPYGITKNNDCRKRITKWILREVAAERGPPTAVQKADELARISMEETDALKTKFEQELNTERRRDYDTKRWGADRSFTDEE